MQKWNISTDRAQRVDEKNGGNSSSDIYSLIKMSKMAHFMYLLLNKAKVWARYLSASEKFYLALLENAMDYVVLSYH